MGRQKRLAKMNQSDSILYKWSRGRLCDIDFSQLISESGSLDNTFDSLPVHKQHKIKPKRKFDLHYVHLKIVLF